MKERCGKMIVKGRKWIKEYKWIIIVGLFLSMPLISRHFVLGHDSLYHVANIDALSEAIKNFNFTKISPIIANNLGYGGAIFYPKLPHFFLALINTILSVFNISPKITVNIGYVIIIILSGIFMYKLLKMIFKKNNMALLGSVIYITMPYFLSEMFVRSALNEAALYIFMPLVFIGLLYLKDLNIKKFYIYFVIGYFGIINSHLVLMVYFTIIVILYLLINIKDYIKKERIKHLFISAGVLLLLSLPTFILMFEHKNLGIYAVFNPKIIISTVENIEYYSLSLNSYLQMNLSTGDLIHHFINIIVIILSIAGILYLILKEKNKDIKMKIFGFLGITILSVIMASSLFPYKYLPKLLLSIQFAFRNETFTCFALSIIAAYSLKWVAGKKILTNIIITITIASSCIISALIINSATVVTEVPWNEYVGMGNQKEYLTMSGLKNLNYIINRDENIKVLSKDSSVKITNMNNNIPNLSFNMKIKKGKDVTLELPRLYYLGYQIELTQKNGKKIELDYEYDKYGLIKITVPKSGYIEMKYTGTLMYQIFSWVRNLGILIFIIIVIKYQYNKKKKNISSTNLVNLYSSSKRM